MSDGTQLLPGFDDAPEIVREVPVRPHTRRISGPPRDATARSSDPDTSRAAAARQHRGGAPKAIIAAFARYGPMTDEGLVQVLPGLVEGTVKTRRSQLKHEGYLEVVGTAKNSRGCDMDVHQLTDAGRERSRMETT